MNSARAAAFAFKFVIFSLLLALVSLLFGLAFSYVDGCFSREAQTGGAAVPPPVCVVIDAGHGGEDGGASGFCETVEKRLNLDIALTLGDMLRVSGIKTVLTRETDRMLYEDYKPGQRKMEDLRGRLAVVEAQSSPVLVSLHMNTFPQEKYSGLQVYFSTNHAGGKRLASGIQTAVKTYLQPSNSREVKPAGSAIWLLKKTDAPAVLVECGFLSNAAEASLLSTKEYRKRLALVICSAVAEYIAEYSAETPSDGNGGSNE